MLYNRLPSIRMNGILLGNRHNCKKQKMFFRTFLEVDHTTFVETRKYRRQNHSQFDKQLALTLLRSNSNINKLNDDTYQ